MARATVTLKEGASYRWGDYTFTASPSYISKPEDIEAVRSIGLLHVVVDEDAPLPPAKPVEEPSTHQSEAEGTAAKIRAALRRKPEGE